MKNKVSDELKSQAMKVAKGTHKSGQTKEQTKLIAQGIEKGIAEYKKQQNKILRERDKQRKQEIKQKQLRAANSQPLENQTQAQKTSKLPWLLLALSWIMFAAYQISIL